MNYPSQLIADAVAEFSRLPGIGEKTALRLVLHLLKQPTEKVEAFGDAIVRMRRDIRFCRDCFNIADADLCPVCLSSRRNTEQVCVVESIREVIAIENTGVYTGLYHVLGGLISPVDGIGPENLHIEALLKRIREKGIKEVIMALNPNMEGDTTIFYLSKKLRDMDVKITSIARGVAFGGELEYTDDLTLARSLTSRLPYENFLTQK